MSEIERARRAEDKRPVGAVDWTDAPRFTALGIAETWAVTVEAEGQRVLCISHEHVTGLDGERLEAFAPTIRSCAQHLLAFMGSGPISSAAGTASGRIATFIEKCGVCNGFGHVENPVSAEEKPAGDLPEKPYTNYNGYSDGSEPLWTAEQMEDYARAAIAAHIARQSQQAEPVAWYDPVGGTFYPSRASVEKYAQLPSRVRPLFAVPASQEGAHAAPAHDLGKLRKSPPAAYIATDLDGHGDVGLTIKDAKRRAGDGCDTIIALHDISADFIEFEGKPRAATGVGEAGAHAARNAVLEEAALAAEKVQDEYHEHQSGRWPELRDDAETGAGACVYAIRSLKTPASAERSADEKGDES
jgi:hypothetical protein